MPVAHPQLGDTGLDPAAHQVSLAGSVEGLHHPAVCPNCGAPAGEPLEITKVFQWIRSDETDGGGWQYRIARTAPLFCRPCAAQHHAEQQPVTGADRARSLLTELTLPALGTGAFGLFLLANEGAGILRDPAGQWFPLALIALLLAIAAACGRAAWTGTEHRRVPAPTPTSRAFDFGDDGSTAYQTEQRRYALRDPRHAAAFEQLNRPRSDTAVGPAARRAERRRFWLAGAVVAVVVLAPAAAKLF